MRSRLQFRNLRGLGAALGIFCGAAGAVRAADPPQPARFLLIFETSPVLKKNLPAVRQDLAGLLASNFQKEMEANDEVAVWTVDESLHTGAFPLTSWAPERASLYSRHLYDFLERQHFTRHARLSGIQPQLNRVVKHSERLTVIIFCDGKSRLVGTPYDSGMNDTLTNAAARIKGPAVPFTLVLRSYRGQYLGGSVNLTSRLSFPPFPPPPSPAPPPVISQPRPVVARTAPAAAPLIIVGTNAATATNPATAANPPAPASVAAPPAGPAPLILSNAPAATTTISATNPARPAVTATAPSPAGPPPPETAPRAATEPKMPVQPPNNPTPAPPAAQTPAANPPPPTETVPTTSAAPATTVSTVTPATPAGTGPPAPVPETKPPAPAAAAAPAERGNLWPLAAGGGALAAAALVIWLVARARRPRGSLITRATQEDLRLPPRK